VIKIILLDGMMQVYRCNAKLPDLTTKTGHLTGMEFGFLKSLEALRRFFKDEIIVCWEGEKNFRYQIDPEYKISRRLKRSKSSHKNLTIDRLNEFKQFLSLIVDYAYDEELEADDLIATLAKRFAQKEKVVIYSNDKDMFQLLQNKPFPIVQCLTYQFRYDLWTKNKIIEKFEGLEPQDLPVYFAFVGDKVDDIIGVERVRRPVIATALFNNYEPENIMAYPLFSASEIYKLEDFIKSGKFQQNLKLTTLRIKDDVRVHCKNWEEKEIAKWLQKMEFTTLKLCQKVDIQYIIQENEEF